MKNYLVTGALGILLGFAACGVIVSLPDNCDRRAYLDEALPMAQEFGSVFIEATSTTVEPAADQLSELQELTDQVRDLINPDTCGEIKMAQRHLLDAMIRSNYALRATADGESQAIIDAFYIDAASNLQQFQEEIRTWQ
jgi:hypothetical protein